MLGRHTHTYTKHCMFTSYVFLDIDKHHRCTCLELFLVLLLEFGKIYNIFPYIHFFVCDYFLEKSLIF